MKGKIRKITRTFLSLLLAGAMALTAQGMPSLANEVAAEAVESTGRQLPKNPVHHCKNVEEIWTADTTDWSYVYFGSYPQTEVKGSALTAAIIGASYDSNGDAWVDGVKYRRLSESDTNNDEDEDFSGDYDYRYFKWERVKWRVLENDGSTLFVMADKGLDTKCYNDDWESITWENCSLRNWLNRDFYSTAFSSGEQGAIVSQGIVNEDNSK